MGEFQAIHKYCAVFLALLACHEVVLTHGRQIKPRNQHSSLNPDTTEHDGNPPGPTLPSFNDPSSVEKKVETTTVQKYEGAGFGGAAYSDNAFRPTTPGNSPGVGHRKFVGEDKDMKAKLGVHSPDVEHFVTKGHENDFRPTAPGHSPGVGHAYTNRNGENK